jgi:A/G-specific adenine glycosylase
LFALASVDSSRRDDISSMNGQGRLYYARARNDRLRARKWRGGFPSTAAELRELPGIGAYTSAAIAAIAFGEMAAAVDAMSRAWCLGRGLEQSRARKRRPSSSR